MKDSRIRSVVKALTWRFIATTTTVSLVYIGTGNIELAAHVGAADVVIKLFFYYVHERAWGRISWHRGVKRA
jgi:adenylylsulfate kinase